MQIFLAPTVRSHVGQAEKPPLRCCMCCGLDCCAVISFFFFSGRRACNEENKQLESKIGYRDISEFIING